jgi:hypothetical protein
MLTVLTVTFNLSGWLRQSDSCHWGPECCTRLSARPYHSPLPSLALPFTPPHMPHRPRRCRHFISLIILLPLLILSESPFIAATISPTLPSIVFDAIAAIPFTLFTSTPASTEMPLFAATATSSRHVHPMEILGSLVAVNSAGVGLDDYIRLPDADSYV